MFSKQDEVYVLREEPYRQTLPLTVAGFNDITVVKLYLSDGRELLAVKRETQSDKRTVINSLLSLEVLFNLGHPYVISPYYFAEYTNGQYIPPRGEPPRGKITEERSVEYLPYASLGNPLSHYPPAFTDIPYVFLQMLQGINWLHLAKQDVTDLVGAHRDVRTENFVHDGQRTLAIDLDMYIDTDEAGVGGVSSNTGTYLYAPFFEFERIANPDRAARERRPKIAVLNEFARDAYSLGIILYELYRGRAQFKLFHAPEDNFLFINFFVSLELEDRPIPSSQSGRTQPFVKKQAAIDFLNGDDSKVKHWNKSFPLAKEVLLKLLAAEEGEDIDLNALNARFPREIQKARSQYYRDNILRDVRGNTDFWGQQPQQTAAVIIESLVAAEPQARIQALRELANNDYFAEAKARLVAEQQTPKTAEGITAEISDAALAEIAKNITLRHLQRQGENIQDWLSKPVTDDAFQGLMLNHVKRGSSDKDVKFLDIHQIILTNLTDYRLQLQIAQRNAAILAAKKKHQAARQEFFLHQTLEIYCGNRDVTTVVLRAYQKAKHIYKIPSLAKWQTMLNDVRRIFKTSDRAAIPQLTAWIKQYEKAESIPARLSLARKMLNLVIFTNGMLEDFALRKLHRRILSEIRMLTGSHFAPYADREFHAGFIPKPPQGSYGQVVAPLAAAKVADIARTKVEVDKANEALGTVDVDDIAAAAARVREAKHAAKAAATMPLPLDYIATDPDAVQLAQDAASTQEDVMKSARKEAQRRLKYKRFTPSYANWMQMTGLFITTFGGGRSEHLVAVDNAMSVLDRLKSALDTAEAGSAAKDEAFGQYLQYLKVLFVQANQSVYYLKNPGGTNWLGRQFASQQAKAYVDSAVAALEYLQQTLTRDMANVLSQESTYNFGGVKVSWKYNGRI